MSNHVEVKSLEMGSIFQVTLDGDIVLTDGEAPPVFLDEAPEHISIDDEGWRAWSTGRSDQEGYAGPILHPSENISAGMERDLRAESGDYALAEVRDVSDPDGLVGWVVLKRRVGRKSTNI